MPDPLHVGRKYPARNVHITSAQPTIIFLTVCAQRPASWLATDSVHDSLTKIWRAADTWLVGDYLLMPDHLHLFCAPRDPTVTLDAWVTYWKRQFTRAHLKQSYTWQRSHFDRRLRDLDDYIEKLQYVRENPLRKNLVTNPDLWPSRGRLNDLRW